MELAMPDSSYARHVASLVCATLDGLLVAVFSPECAGCGCLLLGGNACAFCLDAHQLQEPWCLRCGEPTSHVMGKCGKCRTRFIPELKFVRSLWWLTELNRKLWFRIKYGHRRDLLSAFRSRAITEIPHWALEGFTLVPVPLYFRKYWDRNFNQAEEIARWLSKVWARPLCASGLIKTKETSAQTGLSRSERLRNLKGSFQWNEKVRIPEKVILVDDVMTTGSTLNQCARSLVRAGVKEVGAWTLFRTPEEYRSGI